MKLSDQAMGAVMMALQKSLLDQTVDFLANLCETDIFVMSCPILRENFDILWCDSNYSSMIND